MRAPATAKSITTRAAFMDACEGFFDVAILGPLTIGRDCAFSGFSAHRTQALHSVAAMPAAPTTEHPGPRNMKLLEGAQTTDNSLQTMLSAKVDGSKRIVHFRLMKFAVPCLRVLHTQTRITRNHVNHMFHASPQDTTLIVPAR
jgi:hypothetical protein